MAENALSSLRKIEDNQATYLDAAIIWDALKKLERLENLQPQFGVGLTPVPLTERLPGPDDCDAEGRCWVGYASFVDEIDFGSINYNPSWELCKVTLADEVWLPHDALPTPGEPAIISVSEMPPMTDPAAEPTYVGARKLAAFFRKSVHDADGNSAKVNIDALLDAAELLESARWSQDD